MTKVIRRDIFTYHADSVFEETYSILNNSNQPQGEYTLISTRENMVKINLKDYHEAKKLYSLTVGIDGTVEDYDLNEALNSYPDPISVGESVKLESQNFILEITATDITYQESDEGLIQKITFTQMLIDKSDSPSVPRVKKDQDSGMNSTVQATGGLEITRNPQKKDHKDQKNKDTSEKMYLDNQFGGFNIDDGSDLLTPIIESVVNGVGVIYIKSRLWFSQWWIRLRQRDK